MRFPAALAAVLLSLASAALAFELQVLPGDPSHPSQEYRRFADGVIDGYLDTGRSYRLQFVPAAPGTGLTVVEQGGLLFHTREGRLRPVLPSEANQVTLWLDQLSRPAKGALLVVRGAKDAKADWLVQSVDVLKKRGTPYQELVTGTDVYADLDRYFARKPASAVRNVLVMTTSDYAAIQVVNKLRQLRFDGGMFLFQRSLTSLLLGNVPAWDGITVVQTMFSEPRELFASDRDGPYDALYLAGYSLGRLDGPAQPYHVVMRGTGRRFGIATPAAP